MFVVHNIVLFFPIWVIIMGVVNGGTIDASVYEKLSNVEDGIRMEAVLILPSIMSKVLNEPEVALEDNPSTRTQSLVQLLKEETASSQAPFLDLFTSLGYPVIPYWITNKIHLKGLDRPLLDALIQLDLPFIIREPIPVTLIHPVLTEVSEVIEGRNSTRGDVVEWGVEKIGAPEVWEKGYKGKGIVVAFIDTGADNTHEASSNNWRSEGGWFDSITDSTTPYDDHGHGTHVIGTAVGQTRGVGVAPEAKWIACKGMSAKEGGSELSVSSCAQWLLAPNDKTNLRPQVVSNSWGGGRGLDFFNDEIQAWGVAGIIPIFAIGNSGSGCSSANSPGDQQGLISVGSTNSEDKVSKFSSRGPSVSGKITKPELSGPGEKVTSSLANSGNKYVTLSGTSMAAPHVAGSVALLLSAKPSLSYSEVKVALEGSTYRPSSVSFMDQACSPQLRDDPTYPNNAYGYGRINVAAAVKAISL